MKAIYLEEAVDRFIEQGANLDKDQIIYILNRLPYMDIVLCGECRYMMPDGRCWEFADDAIRPSASDFCSYGERSEE